MTPLSSSDNNIKYNAGTIIIYFRFPFLKIEWQIRFIANIVIIIGNQVLNTTNIYAAVNISINNDEHPLNQQ